MRRFAVRVVVSVVLGVSGVLGGAWALAAADAAAASLPPSPFLESVAPQGLGGLVSWAPDPVSAAVSSYSVQALPAPGTTPPAGCTTVTVSVPSINTAAVVGGLCKGVAYVARVSAVNSAGQGAWSANSNPFAPLPAQVPGSPLVTSVLGREGSLVVGWSAPQENGGSALTGYLVKATAGSSIVSVSVGPGTSTATISGLTDGTSYTVSVVAQNAVGSSPAATSTGVPRAAYAPGAPGQFTAVPSGTGEVDLSWQAPADEGGAAISAYQVTYEQMVRNSSNQWVPAAGATPITQSVAGSVTSLAVAGLSPTNAFWSFSVAAVNSAGTGAGASAGQPIAPQTATTANAVVLSAATMAALSSDANGTLTWPAPAPAQVAGLKAGQVVLAAPAAVTPQGLLDTVQSVTKTASGSYVVGITQAALSDAFTDLSLASTLNPLAPSGAQQQATFRPSLPGLRVLPRAQASVSFSQDIVLGISYGAGPVKISGELDLTPSVGISIALSQGFLGVPNGALVTASASVGAKAALTAALQGSVSKKLGEIDGPPEDYQVGPVPVIVVPKIPIFLTASGQISAQVSASIKIGAQASWDSHHPGTLSVKNLSTPLSVSGRPLDNISASLSIGFKEQPQMDLYDASGPDFEADENLQATVNPNPQAGQNYFTISPSLDLKAGWAIDLLGFHASLNVPIAHLSYAAFVIAKPPGAFLTVSPASPSVPVGANQQFSATRSDGQSFPVTWSVLGGAGDTISSSGLLQAVGPAGRTVTVIATDSTGASGKTTITVGKPFDPPQSLEATSANDGRSATLTWAAPANTGGSALSSYTIVTEPQTANKTAPASSPSTVLTGLTPGVTYEVSVYATNSSGLRSAAATIAFTPEVTCSITWTGVTSTAWSTGSNWAPARVPNKNDLVCINSANVALSTAVTVYGIRLASATLSTASSFTATDLMSLQASTLQGTGATTVSLLAGGTLSIGQGSGLSGVHLVNRGEGALTGSGGVVIEGASTLENAATLTVGDGVSVNWDGSGGGVQNDAGAKLAYPGGAQGASIGAPLRNNGVVSAGGGTLRLEGAVSQSSSGSFTGAGAIVLTSTFSPVGAGVGLADVTVQGGVVGPGTVTIPVGGSVQLGSGSYLSGIDLVNKGALTVGPGPFSMFIEGATTLENAGTLTLGDGASINWDGTSAGVLVNDAGASLTYPGGAQGASIAVPLRNSGVVSAGGGTLTLTGAVSQSGSGSFTGGGAIVLTSTFSPVGSGVSLADVTVQGGVVGPGTVTIPAGGSVQLGSGSYLSGIDLVNKGALTVGPGPFTTTIEGATTLENAGTLTIVDGVSISWDGTSGLLVNDAGATIAYSGGAQGASIAVPLRNSGVVSAGGGTLRLEGAVSQSSSGSFSGGGAIVLTSTFSPVGAGVSLADVTVQGGIVGPGTVTIPAGGAVQMSAGAYWSEIYVVNKGALTVGPGPFNTTVEGATTLENAGTLTIADGASIGGDGTGSGELVNDAGATLTYPGGTQGAIIGVPFDNHGTTSAGGGTLSIASGNTLGASDTGTYSASSGGTIEFQIGSRVLANTFSFQGPGQFYVAGGSVTVPGAVSISNLAVGGGQLDGPGTVTVPSGGKLALGAGAYLASALRLVNKGTATAQIGNAVFIEGGSTLENVGALQLADGSNISYASSPGSGALVNDSGATITYPGGTQGASVGVPFDNHGTVSASVGARGGTLDIASGNTLTAQDTGAYSATSGGTIEFQAGSRVLSNTFSFQGPGQFYVAGGSVTVPGAVSISNLAVGGGGQLDGPGTVTVPSGGKLALGASAYLASALRLVNKGTGTVQIGSAVFIEGGSTLENASTLQLVDGSNISYVYSPALGELVNDVGATLTYPGGTQGAIIGVSFDNHGTVTANVGTRGGTLAINAGNALGGSDTGVYSASSTGTIEFAGGARLLSNATKLTGPGVIAVGGGWVGDSAVANGAALQLQGGTLEVTSQASGKLSSLVENSPAILQFDISPATPVSEPARLAVTGEAALGGTLAIRPASGFVPAAGTVFYLLDYGSVTGQFSSIVTPAGTIHYAVGVGSTALTTSD